MSKDNKKPADKGSSSGKHKSEKGKSGEKSSTNKCSGTAGKSSASNKSTSSSGKSSSGSGKSSSGSSKSASKQSSGATSSAKTISSKSSKSIKLKEYKSTQAGKTSETSLGSSKSSEPNPEPGNIVFKEKTLKETAKNLERKASNEAEAMSPVANSDKQQEHEPLKGSEQPKKLKSNEKVKMDGNVLATILSQNFRGGRSESVKLKVKRESLEKTTAKVENVHGSTFANNIDRDDSAMALVMHTARDEAEVKREETEIFCPGKGDLRSTQPDPTQEDSPKKEP